MKSGICQHKGTGNIIVVFGGKIKLGFCHCTLDGNDYESLSVQEFDKAYNVGDRPNKDEKWDDKKQSIHLLFNNEKSIDILIEALGIVKKILNDKNQEDVLRSKYKSYPPE